MRQDAAIRVPLYQSTRRAEEMLDGAGTVYDIFQVLKHIGMEFGLPHFLVTGALRPEPSRFANRVKLTNWDNELVHRCIEEKVFEQPLFTHPRISVLPSAASCSDFVEAPRYAALRSTLRHLIDCGHDTFAHFPVMADKDVWGGITFTGSRDPVTKQEMIHLEHITALTFVKLVALAGVEDDENPLNRREIECLRLTADGMSVKDIAENVKITVHTVQYHINNAVRKLDAKNKIHAIVIALGKGWLRDPS